MNEECSICFEPMQNSTHVSLECHHKFHKICLDRWVLHSQNNSCPLCRMNISVHMEESFNRVAIIKFCRQQEFIKRITLFQGCVGGLYVLISHNFWCLIPVIFSLYGFVGAVKLDVNKLKCYLIFIGTSIIIRLVDIIELCRQDPQNINLIWAFVPVQSFFVIFDSIIFHTVNAVITKIHKFKSQILNHIGYVIPP